jgi:hypothetical protein
MPALYGSVPASERDAEDGLAFSEGNNSSVPLVKPGVFEAVIQPARRRVDTLTGGVLVAGCLVLAVLLITSSGAQQADVDNATAPGGQATGIQVSSESGASAELGRASRGHLCRAFAVRLLRLDHLTDSPTSSRRRSCADAGGAWDHCVKTGP